MLADKTDFFLVVTEYPKSGGSWLTTLLAEILNIAKRDIYVTPETIESYKTHFFNYNIHDHFWYNDAKSVEIQSSACIKSHELPDSPLIAFDCDYIHLIRDGRDVVVSKYFFEKDFCVKNGLIKEFNISFEDYLVKVAGEWRAYVEAWEGKAPCFKYEDLLLSTKETLIRILDVLGKNYSVELVEQVIAQNTKASFSQRLDKAFKHNSFVRKGISGDWKNYFNQRHCELFNEIAGDVLERLGYLVGDNVVSVSR